MKNFKKAQENLDKARKVLTGAMVKAFPVGSTVYYFHGAQERKGLVLRHGYIDSLVIESPSGKEVDIYAYRIYQVVKK